jgi:hypothetical protein
MSKQMPAPLNAGNSWEEQLSHHTNHNTEMTSAFGSVRETSPLQLLLCCQRTSKIELRAREVGSL